MTRTRVTVSSPAKINVHLGVYPGRNERGYHRADSVMMAVGLCDEVSVAASDSLSVAYEPAIDVEAKQSAVWRAIEALASELGVAPMVSAHVCRAIPSQSGLGSASSDAAAAIRACSVLWGVDAVGPEATKAARAVGADVAFFLAPAPSLMAGVGDVLVATFPALRAPVVLVRPAAGVSTPRAFAAFDALSPTPPMSADAMCAALAAGDVGRVAHSLYNNLADAATIVVPELALVVAWLRRQRGVLGAQVTGSGSCAFALFDSDAAARAAAEEATAHCWWSCATRTVGPEVAVLRAG